MKALCPFCEREYNNLEVQTRYEITTLNGVTAEWQKKYITCPDCGEELYNGELHDANLRVVYAACKVSDINKPVEDLCDYVLKLRMENAALRERLNNVVELPCGIGDTIYTVIKNCAYCKYYNVGWAECRAPATANFDCESTHRICFTQDIVTDECKKHLCVAELKFDLGLLDAETGELKPQYFIDREAAEVRLREMQGEKGE